MRTLFDSTAERFPVGQEADSLPVRVYAAGSLKAAFGDMVRAMAAAGVPEVKLTFGAAGLLKGRIAGGEACDVFASANMAHPRAVGGRTRAVIAFAQNRLCALARSSLDVTPETLLERMLDPGTRIGTSTPGADPSGDYAFEVFAKAETIWPGAQATLAGKAQALTGSANSSRRSRDGRSVYSEIMARNDADIFLTYVTNAAAARREAAGVAIVELPPELAVTADYGLVVLSDRRAAHAAAEWILSPPGQDILVRHGFRRGAHPQGERS